MGEPRAVPVCGDCSVFSPGPFLGSPSSQLWPHDWDPASKTQAELTENVVHKNLPYDLLLFFPVCGLNQGIQHKTQCSGAGLSKPFL